MPKSLPWGRIAVAFVGAATVFGLTPTSAKADALVASFAGSLEDQQLERRFIPQHVPVLRAADTMTTAFGFAANDWGPAQGMPGQTRPAAAKKALALRQALRNPAALAALILLVGDIPSLPPLAGSPPVSPGPPDHGGTPPPPDTTPPSPPPAPEPGALLLALLGGGMLGVYILCRRRMALLKPLAAA
jgi:PEP-CTERM motif